MALLISNTANSKMENSNPGVLDLHLQNLLQGGSDSDAIGRHSGSNKEHMNWAALDEHRESRRYLNKTVSSSVIPGAVPFWMEVRS